MKTVFSLLFSAALSSAAILGLQGCAAPPTGVVKTIAETAPTPVPLPTLVAAPSSAPAPTEMPIATPQMVQTNRSSLPTLPQMMEDSPRPTFIPKPTRVPVVVITNATPVPRQNPTIIVSNEPVAGDQITPQAAAARELVWADSKSGFYFRPGSRFYGKLGQGSYLTLMQAQSRGFHAGR